MATRSPPGSEAWAAAGCAGCVLGLAARLAAWLPAFLASAWLPASLAWQRLAA